MSGDRNGSGPAAKAPRRILEDALIILDGGKAWARGTYRGMTERGRVTYCARAAVEHAASPGGEWRPEEQRYAGGVRALQLLAGAFDGRDDLERSCALRAIEHGNDGARAWHEVEAVFRAAIRAAPADAPTAAAA